MPLTVVLETTDATKLAIAKSLLSAEGIEFVVYGEEVQDLFGIGRFPSGANLFMGPMRLLVAPENAAVASECLSAQPEAETDADAEHPSAWRVAKPVAKTASSIYLGYLALGLGAALLAAIWGALTLGR